MVWIFGRVSGSFRFLTFAIMKLSKYSQKHLIFEGKSCAILVFGKPHIFFHILKEFDE